MTEQTDVITLELEPDLIEELHAEAKRQGMEFDVFMSKLLETIIAEEIVKAEEAGQLTPQ